jgi:hypothetical protein
MKKLKGFSMAWWITGVTGLALFVGVIVFELFINCTVFINPSITISQRVTNVAGIIMICYGWYLFIDWLIKFIRKFIRKHLRSNNSYNQEKIDKIIKQMDNSISHLKETEE